MRKSSKLIFTIALAFLFVAPVLAQNTIVDSARGSGLSNASIYYLISNLLRWLLYIFGFLGVIGFVISGIQYITAAGDDSQIGKAKTNMTWSIVGIIVGLSGLIVVTAVSRWLGGYSISF